MAANTALGATSSLPRHVVLAGVGTTWQEFTLHQGARPGKVTVFADATCYVAFSGDNSAASPADGGAVGTMKITLTAAPWSDACWLGLRGRGVEHHHRNAGSGVDVPDSILIAEERW